ncbi:hypothetical protein [Pyrodictium abyssi]|uniref:Uncharacterized protein n=1 Tax=Pyrodictium abyssi TaxID=54256 RepID=A0ABM8J063_9CREN|nr:hypothetical protein PABY_23830 [Pyrodictium abyssi]
MLGEDVAEELGLRHCERLVVTVEDEGATLHIRVLRARGGAVDALRELEEILRRVEEKRVRVDRIPERWELYEEGAGGH